MNKKELFEKLEETNEKIFKLEKRKAELLTEFNKEHTIVENSIYEDGGCNHGVLQACPNCYDNAE